MTETAKEYAVALFELGLENNCTEGYLESLLIVLKQFEDCPEYITLLSSPNIPISERKELIEKAFSGALPEYVLSFTELLCENGNISIFAECVKEYDKLYKASIQKTDVRVISAVKLSDEEKSVLIEKLKKQIEGSLSVSYAIDEAIIGGLIIYVDDKIIDGSIRHKLKLVKEELKR